MKALISTIQRYSLNDGPGIRTTVFMMGCNLRCPWCSNPESLIQSKRVMVFPIRCVGCGECIKFDTQHALKLDGRNLSFDASKDLRPFLNICPYRVFEEVGEEIEAEELIHRVLRDRTFYEDSKGGVTFSGGEPLLQGEFIVEVAQKLHDEGIHVTIETTGNVQQSLFKQLDPFVDLYYFDLKAIDDELHRDLTGVSNELIHSNVRYLLDSGNEVIIRMVIAQDINVYEQEWQKRLVFFSSLPKSLHKIELLGYHALGIGKYKALGIPYTLGNIQKSDLSILAQSLIDLGFEVKTEEAL